MILILYDCLFLSLFGINQRVRQRIFFGMSEYPQRGLERRAYPQRGLERRDTLFESMGRSCGRSPKKQREKKNFLSAKSLSNPLRGAKSHFPKGSGAKQGATAPLVALRSPTGIGAVVTPLAALIFHCWFLVLSPPPPVNRYKQEQPNYINKMPIPSRSFKPKMMLWCKVIHCLSNTTNKQEQSSHKYVKSVEASC